MLLPSSAMAQDYIELSLFVAKIVSTRNVQCMFWSKKPGQKSRQKLTNFGNVQNVDVDFFLEMS